MANYITYADKVGLIVKTVHINQWWDDDANEVRDKHNLNDDRITVLEGKSVDYGTATQVPFINSGGDGFQYSSNLTFTGSKLQLIGTMESFIFNVTEVASVATPSAGTGSYWGRLDGTPMYTDDSGVDHELAEDVEYIDLQIPLGTPASATDTGTINQIKYDANYIYICTATNTWKRAAISTW